MVCSAGVKTDYTIGSGDVGMDDVAFQDCAPQQGSGGTLPTHAIREYYPEAQDPEVCVLMQDMLRRPTASQPALSVSADGPGYSISSFPFIPSIETRRSSEVEQLAVSDMNTSSPADFCYLTYPWTPPPRGFRPMPPTVGTLSIIPVLTTPAFGLESPRAAAPAAIQRWQHRQQELQHARQLLAAVEAQHAHHHPAVAAADRALVAAMRAASAAELAAAASEQAAVAAERALYRAIYEMQFNQHHPM